PRPLSTSSPPAAATLVASTLSLHDALPIFLGADARLRRETVAEHVAAHERVAARVDVDPEGGRGDLRRLDPVVLLRLGVRLAALDRKSTRLNSSHVKSSYAVFCLKKKTFCG